MLKSSLVSGVLLLSVTAGFVVADERQQLTKNPFLQPDILSYRPPVQVTQPQGRVEPEVWEPPTLELKAVVDQGHEA